MIRWSLCPSWPSNYNELSDRKLGQSPCSIPISTNSSEIRSKNSVLGVSLHSLLVSASRFFKVFSFSFRLPLLLFTFILCRDQTHLDHTLSNKMKTSLRYVLLACLAVVSAAPLLERDSIGNNPCYLILFLLLIGTRCLLSSTRPIAALRSVLSISLLL